MQQQSQEVGTNDPSSNIMWFVMNCVMEMRNARASKDEHKYWVHFDTAFQILMNFMTDDERIILEAEYRELVELERVVRNNKDMHEQTKEKTIERIRAAFSDVHRSRLYKTLPRAGIIRLADDGVIDFNKTDYEILKKLIRSSTGGAPSNMERAMEGKDATITVDDGR